jgi:hypothetical protein
MMIKSFWSIVFTPGYPFWKRERAQQTELHFPSLEMGERGYT